MTDIASASSREQAQAWSLVLSAAGVPHVMVFEQGNWTLRAPPHLEETARREIAAYEAENRKRPPARRWGAQPVEGQPPMVLVMGALFLFYAVTGPWSEHSRWFARGAVATGKILEQGEWWRVVTGLTLHADAVHLLGNLSIGGVLAYFLCRMLGSGLGLFLILLAGGLGNALNVALRGPGFQSVGFSTAVFGTVGILSGLQMVRVGSLKGGLLALGGAAGLLAFLGAEGERVDLGAHLWGLLCGIGLGFLVARPAVDRWMRQPWLQWALAAVAGFFVWGSWWLACR